MTQCIVQRLKFTCHIPKLAVLLGAAEVSPLET